MEASEQYRLLMADVYELAGLSRRTSEAIARELGQTVARWHVLSVLSAGPCTVPAIARRLGLTRQGVQRVADDLLAARLLTASPNPDHARSPLLTLTNQGQLVLEQLTQRSDAARGRLLHKAHITAEDLEAARTTLRALLQSLVTSDRNFSPGIPATGAELPDNDRMSGDVAVTDPGHGTARPGPAAAGIALAVLSAGTFGTSGIFASALISTGWSPAAVAIARLGGSAVLLGVPAVLQLRGRWALLRRQAGTVVVYGVVAIAGGQLCYFNAIESIPIGLAVLLEYLGVVLIVGWLWAVRGQRPGRLTAAGAVAALAGLALLAGLAGSARVSPAGIMWGLGEAVSLAAYFLLSAAAGDQVLPPLVMAWAGLGAGAAVLAVAGWTGALRITASAAGVELLHRHLSWIVPVLELALVSAVIAYVAGIAAARRLGARLASFTGMAEVLFAVLYAWLLLGQMSSPAELTGGTLMLTGVILIRADDTRQSALT